MDLRTIFITAGFAMASTFCLAQRTSTPPPATTTATGPTSGTPAAPGQTSVPVGTANAVGVGAASGTVITPVPTAIVVPTNATGFVGPSQSFPLVSTPTLTFVNSPDGTTTVPVVSYGGSGVPNPAASANPSAATATAQVPDLNLGSVSSVSELYGGDNRSVAEVARQYKARRNGVQNARVYTNADIDRIRSQAGERSSAMPASDQNAMPASDQSAEQNQGTTPQVQQPANQKPSPFMPKK